LTRKLLLASLLLLYAIGIRSQSEEHAWVYFKDKPGATAYLDDPETMLSRRALERRARQNIDIDLLDVPVNSDYVTTVNSVAGVDVMAISKWLNAVHVIGSESEIRSLNGLEFVDRVDFADNALDTGTRPGKPVQVKNRSNKFDITGSEDYGVSFNQISMLNGDYLHDNGYRGNGMVMALMDAGYPNVDTHPAFSRLRNEGRLLGGYNFVDRSNDIYSRHTHGMSVLSTIAGYIEGELIGTAPEASFYLFITEDSTKETPLEESLWVEAAERADSLGVDVINTSLGYFTFDDPSYDYAYADMDGKTTFISRGASVAFSRGMVVVTSAGNEGNDPWRYIIAPADTEEVLGIGAVDGLGNPAFFSSYGPTPDGRIKPDVSARGQGAHMVRPNGLLGPGNGTSFSSPILSGVVTCLWQAFPDLTNTEIVELVRQSGHLYPGNHPQIGFGIPDFEAIARELTEDSYEGEEPLLYPNPVGDMARVKFPMGISAIKVEIMNVLGKQVHSESLDRSNPRLDLANLVPGIYLVKMTSAGKDKATVIKMIKE
jgi:subtilisin family serine protease